jgi:hypothetical protein
MSKRLVQPTDLDPEAEAERREQLHHEAGDYRAPVGEITGYEADLKGLRGEKEFALVFGQSITCLYGPGGDGGADFCVDFTIDGQRRSFDVDVKAASKPVWLISWAKEGETRPNTIYVLAHHIDAEARAVLLGWQWGSVLMKSTPRRLGSRMVYWVPRKWLRSIDELKKFAGV